ncbi:hypothetical protein OESDEN_00231 [Oesophagostomum dentatum]|uniref:Uncharacterized protein n=1 Tax=Oesophagostomum dentatum TaxID=61180 RepID=A0A0B1TUH0_OESDE|nr:hypothetical protein OESDEN_00231 [Oesophagostomum dentatum]
MRELCDRYGFTNNGNVELSRFAALFDELDQAKHQETNRWKERIGFKMTCLRSVSGAYQIPSDKQENTVHTIRTEVRESS